MCRTAAPVVCSSSDVRERERELRLLGTPFQLENGAGRLVRAHALDSGEFRSSISITPNSSVTPRLDPVHAEYNTAGQQAIDRLRSRTRSNNQHSVPCILLHGFHTPGHDGTKTEPLHASASTLPPGQPQAWSQPMQITGLIHALWIVEKLCTKRAFLVGSRNRLLCSASRYRISSPTEIQLQPTRQCHVFFSPS